MRVEQHADVQRPRRRSSGCRRAAAGGGPADEAHAHVESPPARLRTARSEPRSGARSIVVAVATQRPAPDRPPRRDGEADALIKGRAGPAREPARREPNPRAAAGLALALTYRVSLRRRRRRRHRRWRWRARSGDRGASALATVAALGIQGAGQAGAATRRDHAPTEDTGEDDVTVRGDVEAEQRRGALADADAASPSDVERRRLEALPSKGVSSASSVMLFVSPAPRAQAIVTMSSSLMPATGRHRRAGRCRRSEPRSMSGRRAGSRPQRPRRRRSCT